MIPRTSPQIIACDEYFNEIKTKQKKNKEGLEAVLLMHVFIECLRNFVTEQLKLLLKMLTSSHDEIFRRERTAYGLS